MFFSAIKTNAAFFDSAENKTSGYILI